MRNTQFPGVAEQLLNAGVSPRRVRRMLAELADHFEDLREELQAGGLSRLEAEAEAASRLKTDALVEGVLARPELRSWVRRWPWFAFTVVPIAMYAALAIATIAATVVLVEFAKSTLGMDISSSVWIRLFARVLLGSVAWVLPVVAAAACCAVALSRRVPAIWAVVGVVLVSSLGAVADAQLQLPPVVPRPAFNAGLGFSTDALLPPISRAALTLTIVLVGYFWFRMMQMRGRPSQAT